MAMLTNGPPPGPPLPSGPECFLNGVHRRNIHEFQVRKVAETDGTPVHGAPMEKTYLCEGHAPRDPDDPKFLLCTCRLCRERKAFN